MGEQHRDEQIMRAIFKVDSSYASVPGLPALCIYLAHEEEIANLEAEVVVERMQKIAFREYLVRAGKVAAKPLRIPKCLREEFEGKGNG